MANWDDTYEARDENALTWFEAAPDTSLALIDRAGLPDGAACVDIGAGTSRLAGALLKRGAGHVTLLDLSSRALQTALAHLPADAPVTTIVGDVTEWHPDRAYDLWHDRATFHFLTERAKQDRYLRVLERAVCPGGGVVIATFAEDGPDRCSNLPVQRYSAPALAARLGDGFEPVETRRHVHVTPKGNEQPFTYLLARRRAG